MFLNSKYTIILFFTLFIFNFKTIQCDCCKDNRGCNCCKGGKASIPNNETNNKPLKNKPLKNINPIFTSKKPNTIQTDTSIEKKPNGINEKEQIEKNIEIPKKNIITKEKYKKIDNECIKDNEGKQIFKEKVEHHKKLTKKEQQELEEKQKKLEEEQKLEEQKKLEEEQKKLEELKKLPNLVGLQNIGATCYMNATLQALSNTNSLTEYFLNPSKFNPNNPNKKMSNEYYKVLRNLWSDTKKDGDYAPYDFKKALSEENPLFAGVQANDSKDLINFLLERFHQELNNPKPNKNNNVDVNQMDENQTLMAFISNYSNSNQSIINNSFYGILETKSQCSGCNTIKYNFQIYSFLEFPLQQVNQYFFYKGKRPLFTQDGKNPDVDLYECFEYYRKVDILNGQNQMFCNICNGNRDTYYGTTIYSLPNYLIINLNRGKGAVYECKVNFPEELNLYNYITANAIHKLQLYAVICHLGESSMNGHFIAYCRHRQNNKWYKYNDSFVTECTKAQEYNDGMPYILFYKAV